MIGDSEHNPQLAVIAGVSAAAIDDGALCAARLLEFPPLILLANFTGLSGWLANPEAKGHRRSGMS